MPVSVVFFQRYPFFGMEKHKKPPFKKEHQTTLGVPPHFRSVPICFLCVNLFWGAFGFLPFLGAGLRGGGGGGGGAGGGGVGA